MLSPSGLLTSARFLSFGVGGGYGGTLTLGGGLYITGLFIMGLGGQTKTMSFTDRTETETQFANKSSLRAGF